MLNESPFRSFVSKYHILIGTGGAVLLILFLIIGVGKRTALVHSSSDDSDIQRKMAVEKLANSPDLLITADNSEQPPLLILAANVKQVTGEEYHQLTGIKADSPNYITFPQVKVINNADKGVKTFTLCLLHSHSDRKDCIKRTNVTIEPSVDFSLEPLSWAGPRKAMMRKIAEKEGVSQQDKSKPGLDSAEMWLAGSTADYTLVVASVEFSDGTKWVTKR